MAHLAKIKFDFFTLLVVDIGGDIQLLKIVIYCFELRLKQLYQVQSSQPRLVWNSLHKVFTMLRSQGGCRLVVVLL